MGDEKVSILVLLCRLVVFPENVFTVKRDKVSTLLMALLLSFKNSCFIIGSGVLVTQLSLTLCNSMDCSLSGSSVHGILQGRITGEGSHSLLQGIFLTQGSNPGFLHCIRFPYCLSHQGSPAGSRRKVCLTRASQVVLVVTNHPVQER